MRTEISNVFLLTYLICMSFNEIVVSFNSKKKHVPSYVVWYSFMEVNNSSLSGQSTDHIQRHVTEPKMLDEKWQWALNSWHWPTDFVPNLCTCLQRDCGTDHYTFVNFPWMKVHGYTSRLPATQLSFFILLAQLVYLFTGWIKCRQVAFIISSYPINQWKSAAAVIAYEARQEINPLYTLHVLGNTDNVVIKALLCHLHNYQELTWA